MTINVINNSYSFCLLITSKWRRKSPVKSLPPLVVLCTLDWSFCFLYLLARVKDYSSSSSKWLVLNTFHNNFIPSFLIYPYGKEIQQTTQGQSLATYHTAYTTPHVLHNTCKQEHEPERFTVYHGAFKYQYHNELVCLCVHRYCKISGSASNCIKVFTTILTTIDR